MEYTPGQILNEKVLAKEFGISRSSIKDVLYHLEWEQFVRVIPRTGSMVTEIELKIQSDSYFSSFWKVLLCLLYGSKKFVPQTFEVFYKL
jgi:DNA-binding FadR family transcriptional regulator